MGRVFDEFEIGQRFVTPGRTITEADIGAFAGLTGDYNPVHTDETFAATTDFGSRIAHGPMGIGIAFGLASRLDLIDGTVVALLGVNWDFKAPMRPGDTVRALISVTGKRPVKNPSLGLIELAIELVSQREEILQSGSARLLLRKTRPPSAIWGQVESGKMGDP
ncbi:MULTISPECIES: MaoC/PaaZ C-terminal domain-containing protein [Bradyrhizobium]|jgi:acyl dehydratase|uniref:Acyl dehydratase n=2 Tax=Bradyrhizobium TaxID=374 RepID=A0ABY0P9A6_9BRAD|nr:MULTISPECIES: MaoC/PaaZ C-terminal domain-containing protein [Bradyrhizobium]SDH74899.1 Acyl dehydratase [Bradyrhizobium ottawaense]SEE09860.1 Acyl dehydratase [Bradyrhizobium lablabi]SHM05613.1 Acyl dehydratase [Bradyrhizobium lablabi]